MWKQQKGLHQIITAVSQKSSRNGCETKRAWWRTEELNEELNLKHSNKTPCAFTLNLVQADRCFQMCFPKPSVEAQRHGQQWGSIDAGVDQANGEVDENHSDISLQSEDVQQHHQHKPVGPVGPCYTHLQPAGEVWGKVIFMEAKMNPSRKKAKHLNYAQKHKSWGAEHQQQVLWTDEPKCSIFAFNWRKSAGWRTGEQNCETCWRFLQVLGCKWSWRPDQNKWSSQCWDVKADTYPLCCTIREVCSSDLSDIHPAAQPQTHTRSQKKASSARRTPRPGKDGELPQSFYLQIIVSVWD